MRNPEGHPEGDARWGERGASGESSKGVTRFISSLREISRVVPVRATAERLSRDLAGDPKHIYKHKIQQESAPSRGS